MKYSIGIGTTNRCNFNCAHCYSRIGSYADLNLDDIKRLFESIEIDSVNFGTGENLLNKDFIPIVEYLCLKGVKMSLTSNGYSILNMDSEHILLFNDVDISIDFCSYLENDIFRSKNSSKMARDAIEKLLELEVETSIATCLMRRNFDKITSMLNLARDYGINLRINIYKAVHNKSLALTYDQFWKSANDIFTHGRVISCSEPVVNSILGIKILDGGCPCGKTSFRVTPFKYIKPCVYWNTSDITIDDLYKEGESAIVKSGQFKKIRDIPDICKDCEHLEICKGGCAARRLYSGDYSKPDEYCYKYNHKEPTTIKYTKGSNKDLVHSTYLCTFIVE